MSAVENLERWTRTEEEVALEVLAELFIARMLPNSTAAMRDAARTVGVSTELLRSAILGRRTRPYRSPSSVITRNVRKGRHLSAAPDIKELTGQTRHCRFCDRVQPIEDFPLRRTKKDATARWYCCKTCYQVRRRPVVVEAHSAGDATVTFEVAPGESGVLRCKHCHELLEVGDEVTAMTALAHSGCHEDPA